MKGCCLILSCSQQKYEKERFENWEKSIHRLAYTMPIFYVFGKSEQECRIPEHRNVYKIVADCNDWYEDIPLKIYYGFRFLSNFQFDYIMKLDENISIKNVAQVLLILKHELQIHDYIALKGVGFDSLNLNRWHIMYYHVNKVHNANLNYVPCLCNEIPYAGGPAYVVTNKAYSTLRKVDFLTSLYEDYSVGYALLKKNIYVYTSEVVDELLIEDKNIQIPNRFKSKAFTDIKHSVSVEQTLEDMHIPPKRCIMKLQGGLGNQLFQLATGISYSIKYDMDLCIIVKIANNIKYYWDTILEGYKHRIIENTIKHATVYRQQDTDFSYTMLPSSDRDVVFIGTFQSSKFFPNIGKLVKHALRFPENTNGLLYEKYGFTMSKNCVIVHAKRNSDYIVDSTYYEQAKQHILTNIKNPKFILISDDMNFWKESTLFTKEESVCIDESDIVTMYLMIHSHSFILSNSAFSWWGAYLSNSKLVIAPKQWYSPNVKRSWTDIYEPGWIQI